MSTKPLQRIRKPSGKAQALLAAGGRPRSRPHTPGRTAVGGAENRIENQAENRIENRALIELAQQIAGSPDRVFEKLAGTALALCHAQSAGVSLFEPDLKRFRWPGLCGPWAAAVFPRIGCDFDWLRAALESDAPRLIPDPKRLFRRFAPGAPAAEEALFLPFHIERKAAGAIWLIQHSKRRHFGSEDLRVMASLGAFAGVACQVLAREQELTRRVAQLEEANREVREARRAAFNVTEDVITAWQAAENLNVQLRSVEQSLRTSRNELRKQAQILELAHEPIIVRDLDDRIVYWNKGAERLYGWSAEEAAGKQLHALLHTEFPRSLEAALDELRSRGFWEGELRKLTRDGSAVVVISRWVVQKDGQGNAIAYLGTDFDITERKQSEAALRTTEKLATVGRMAATLAHEVNNPLESVTNLVYLARQEPELPGPVRNYLNQAEQELARVGHMARQALGLYRESAQPGPVLVSDLLKSLLSMYSPRIKAKHIRAELKIVHEVEAQGVSGELRQVFSNLLGNSIDAVVDGGAISLRVASTGAGPAGRKGGVRVMVADNGSGIPPGILQRIFEPFLTTKRDVGTGLGLWVSKGITEQHSGSIRLRSLRMPGGNWTVASVFLPAAQTPRKKPLRSDGATPSKITLSGSPSSTQQEADPSTRRYAPRSG